MRGFVHFRLAHGLETFGVYSMGTLCWWCTMWTPWASHGPQLSNLSFRQPKYSRMLAHVRINHPHCHVMLGMEVYQGHVRVRLLCLHPSKGSSVLGRIFLSSSINAKFQILVDICFLVCLWLLKGAFLFVCFGLLSFVANKCTKPVTLEEVCPIAQMRINEVQNALRNAAEANLESFH